ncbi:MAG: type II toxin-antitoxin system RelE/ParE family toxin [Candidatus Sumerlaeota bacterium]|nr:type II toxin-antitoxin system RelE/ParE family toxin [Candidatus Sumerlaeota bacterium]
MLRNRETIAGNALALNLAFLLNCFFRGQHGAIKNLQRRRSCFFRDHRGQSPVIEWLRESDDVTQAKAGQRFRSLASEGHALNRPLAEHVEGDIYALRIKSSSKRQFRIFYFFHHRTMAILTHGFLKASDKIPPSEIARAKRYRELFVSDPDRYTYKR